MHPTAEKEEMRPGRCLDESSSSLPSFSAPIHAKTSSPCQGGGSGVHWIGLGPPGCAEERTIPWESWEWGLAPDSASVLLAVSGLFSHCPSLSSPIPEADLIALLCQTLVSGCVCGAGAARHLEGEEERSSCDGDYMEGASTFWLWTCEERAVGAVTHPGS